MREAAQRVSNEAAYRFTQRVLVLPMILGIFIVIVGQSVSGARFGWAWAEGVVAQELNEDQTGPLVDGVQRRRERRRTRTTADRRRLARKGRARRAGRRHGWCDAHWRSGPKPLALGGIERRAV